MVEPRNTWCTVGKTERSDAVGRNGASCKHAHRARSRYFSNHACVGIHHENVADTVRHQRTQTTEASRQRCDDSPRRDFANLIRFSNKYGAVYINGDASKYAEPRSRPRAVHIAGAADQAGQYSHESRRANFTNHTVALICHVDVARQIHCYGYWRLEQRRRATAVG